jgi:hypothetical protein
MKKYLHIAFIILFVQCRDRYEPAIKPEETNLLVVQGFINSHGQTQINLSRTTLLSDSGVAVETGAIITIEGDDNSIYPLVELDSGRYISQYNTLNNNVRYRLNIRSINGKSYLSDWRNEIKTPAIDSVTFIRPGNGIEIYVNAKDPQNKTRYYRWTLEEDWEIHSEYKTNAFYTLNRRTSPPTLIPQYYYPDTRDYNLSLYYCWRSRKSSSIILGTTEKLAEDRVYFPVVAYKQGAEELSVLYRILVRQYGMSKEGYAFYEKMKKNSENLGTTFDPQPSELKGNFTCVESPKEAVIGFMEVSTVEEKIEFIANAQLPEWNYNSGCEREVFMPAVNDTMLSAVYYAGRLLTSYNAGRLPSVTAADKKCVDCTLRGTNIKPAFWP